MKELRRLLPLALVSVLSCSSLMVLASANTATPSKALPDAVYEAGTPLDDNSATLPPANTAVNDASDEAIFNEISNSTNATPEVAINDPLEKYNRWMFRANDRMDKAVAKPLARAYNYIMPQPLYGMVDNFFVNVDTIPTIGNDILQANFYQATADAWHLLINSTLGIGGLFNPAGHMGLEKNYSDFGLTMAKWGWTNSSYLVIPILGPSTIRDGGGRMVTYYMSPYPYIQDLWIQYGIYFFGLLNTRAQLLRYQGVVDQASIDPYVFMRSAYYQRRAYQIQQVNNSVTPYNGEDMKKYYDPMYIYN